MIPERPASRLRILRVQGAAGLIGALAPDAPDVEIVIESGPTRALERLESDGDFALVVCDENVGGTSGLELLAAVRALSPTTVRVLVSESLARARTSGHELAAPLLLEHHRPLRALSSGSPEARP